MPQLSSEQVESLAQAIRTHDFLRQLLRELEKLHRAVFHTNERADWAHLRAACEQILIAEIVSRHKGNIDGIYFALRSLEGQGKRWDIAIHELAGTIHSYFTTPLGMVMRADLFGDGAIFVSPDAQEWIRERRAARAAAGGRR